MHAKSSCHLLPLRGDAAANTNINPGRRSNWSELRKLTNGPPRGAVGRNGSPWGCIYPTNWLNSLPVF